MEPKLKSKDGTNTYLNSNTELNNNKNANIGIGPMLSNSSDLQSEIAVFQVSSNHKIETPFKNTDVGLYTGPISSVIVKSMADFIQVEVGPQKENFLSRDQFRNDVKKTHSNTQIRQNDKNVLSYKNKVDNVQINMRKNRYSKKRYDENQFNNSGPSFSVNGYQATNESGKLTENSKNNHDIQSKPANGTTRRSDYFDSHDTGRQFTNTNQFSKKIEHNENEVNKQTNIGKPNTEVIKYGSPSIKSNNETSIIKRINGNMNYDIVNTSKSASKVIFKRCYHLKIVEPMESEAWFNSVFNFDDSYNIDLKYEGPVKITPYYWFKKYE